MLAFKVTGEYVYVYVYVYVHVCVCVLVCVYVYVCMYTSLNRALNANRDATWGAIIII